MPNKFVIQRGPLLSQPTNRFWHYQRAPNSHSSSCDVNNVVTFRTTTFVKNNIFGGHDIGLMDMLIGHYYQLLLTDEDESFLIDENGYKLILDELCL